jgi:redox-sensitive bicupin YhaK (pirin superfamily)
MSPALALPPAARDLGGGFSVRRLLPGLARRSVGPFVFFDHFGPLELAPGAAHDVRPHPHIGLSTITWLYAGEMVHRDSTGAVQAIRPGAVNWMTAGRGVVHSERMPPAGAGPRAMHGIQLWAALPQEDEDMPPYFSHTPASALPTATRDGAAVTLLLGSAVVGGDARVSPVPVRGAPFAMDLRLEPGGAATLGASAAERAVYLVAGDASLDGEPLALHHLTVLPPGAAGRVQAGPTGAIAFAIGGPPLDGPRVLWWNFVSSQPARVEAAAAAWEAGAFPPIPGEHERIPAPPLPARLTPR